MSASTSVPPAPISTTRGAPMAVSASSGGASTTSTAASMSAAAAPASAPAAAAAFAATAPDATLPDAAGISSPHELTDWVERLVDGLEAKFNGMSESVEVRMREMSARLDALEASIKGVVSLSHDETS
ncbi:hypothetical protein FA09DRAFT_330826 [Tilletiopsis washingtonensis]|uniref:Heat shock factor binding protein 1 n=1 Tax=Tilletiopsis washingtonensis TaxID=58919 RepID=A0A316Z828_9BASI|nr:hypothetical protein FA09DRAFT_330826 [Tilletiopsis washingtonensis]PWN97194.1 hypothetical protein FA09DRAFT_330826 [Tilletiopsis washingtonensis]